jgi:predicted amidohydrolase YtcJ
VRTLFRRGRVARSPTATAVLVAGASITAIGADDVAERLGLVPDRIVDLAGALIAPAFVDAHVHLTQTGLLGSTLDLRGVGSLQQALDAIGGAASGRADVVLGGGWDEHGWPERRPPTAVELQRAARPGVAVWLGRVDGHSSVSSTVLLDSAPELAALPGYDPSGWLRGAAHVRARQIALRAVPPAQRRAAQTAALDAAAAAGIGCVHEMATPELSDATDLAELLAADHAVTVIGYWGELGGVSTADRLGAAGAAGDLSCDGSIGSRTAWLHEPYRGSSDCGAAFLDAAQIGEHVLACTAAGLQAGFHAIGDAAVDAVVEGMERAIAVAPQARTAGHRIEHAELVTDPARLAATGVTASVQPAFDAVWGGPSGMYADRLGADRAARMNNLAGLLAAGVPLAFGSDSPVTPFDPWGTIRAAIGPQNPGAALSAEHAFAAHTVGGWRAARRAGGVLQDGAPATLAVWDVAGRSPFDADHPRPRCLATLVDGRVAFRADALRDAL